MIQQAFVDMENMFDLLAEETEVIFIVYYYLVQVNYMPLK